MFNFYGIRRFLILALAGKCSVVVNTDIYGKYHMKGPWLLMHNAIAQDPAPDLLEVLQALQRAGGIWPDLKGRVDAAVAKAVGAA